jgi:hypothetical protein
VRAAAEPKLKISETVECHLFNMFIVMIVENRKFIVDLTRRNNILFYKKFISN